MAPRVCRICGSGRLRPLCRLPEFRVVACGDCGHGMTVYTASVPDNQERFQHPRYIESRDIQHTTIRAIAARRYAELRAFVPAAT